MLYGPEQQNAMPRNCNRSRNQRKRDRDAVSSLGDSIDLIDYQNEMFSEDEGSKEGNATVIKKKKRTVKTKKQPTKSKNSGTEEDEDYYAEQSKKKPAKRQKSNPSQRQHVDPQHVVFRTDGLVYRGVPTKDLGRPWPAGWKELQFERRSGATQGKLDWYWYPPSSIGKDKFTYKLRSLAEVRRFLEAQEFGASLEEAF